MTPPLWLRFVDRVSSVSATVGAVCIVLMALHVTADVTGRFAFNHPLPATLEFVGFGWIPLIVFLGLAEAQRRNEHLRVTLSVERVPSPQRRVPEAVASLLTSLVLALVIFYATQTGIRAVEIGEAQPAVVHVPIWPFRLVAVLGLLLLLAQTVASFYRVMADSPSPDHPVEELEQLKEDV